MEIRLTQEQEAIFTQLASDEGSTPDELVQEAIQTFAITRQANRLSDAERAAMRAAFVATLDEADTEIDRGECTEIAMAADSQKLLNEIMDYCRATIKAVQPATH